MPAIKCEHVIMAVHKRCLPLHFDRIFSFTHLDDFFCNFSHFEVGGLFGEGGGSEGSPPKKACVFHGQPHRRTFFHEKKIAHSFKFFEIVQ